MRPSYVGDEAGEQGVGHRLGTGRGLEDARVDPGQQPGETGQPAHRGRAVGAAGEVLLERPPVGRGQGTEDVGAVLVREVAAHAVTPISSSARPNGLADYGSPEADARRKAGVELAKRWLEGCKVLGVKSMRMNSPQALGPSIRPNAVPRGPGDGYPRNIDLIPLLEAAIESHKEMADFGGKLGIKVTIENHWAWPPTR